MGESKSKSDWLFFDLLREGVRPKIRVKHIEEEKKEREERENPPFTMRTCLLKEEKGVKRGKMIFFWDASPPFPPIFPRRKMEKKRGGKFFIPRVWGELCGKWVCGGGDVEFRRYFLLL